MSERDFERPEEWEAEFRAMFAERSRDVRATTSPYRAMRQRILEARRKRRQRIGGAGAALAVAAVGLGVWATMSGGSQGAPPAVPVSTSASAPATPAKYVYNDGRTELPAGPLLDAAQQYLKTNYHGDLGGATVVTTFDQAMQQAAEASKSSPNDLGLAALDPGPGMSRR
ncbi:hypothetical protein ACFQ9X_46550 [Catenulispora yoronensis]